MALERIEWYQYKHIMTYICTNHYVKINNNNDTVYTYIYLTFKYVLLVNTFCSLEINLKQFKFHKYIFLSFSNHIIIY